MIKKKIYLAILIISTLVVIFFYQKSFQDKEIEIKKEGKIAKSINVPFQTFSKYLADGKDAGKKLLVYCAVGERSNLAVQISKSYPNKNVFHLVGGLKNWKNKSLETQVS